MEKCNWTFNGDCIYDISQVPKGAIGFIYEITYANGKKYVGKKDMFTDRNIEVSQNQYNKLKDEGKEVKRTKDKKRSKPGEIVWKFKKRVVKESNWKTYTGSSKVLKTLPKKDKEMVKREIIEFCHSKLELTYKEVKYQMIKEVLEKGEYYNDNILGKFYLKF